MSLLHTFATHTPLHDTTAHLTYAAQLVKAMNLEQRLADARTEKSPRGTKAKLVAYNANAIVCVIYELVASNQPYTIKAILDALWHRYTPDEMTIIGLGDLRTYERMAALHPPAHATPTQTTEAKRVYEAEYQRLWKACETLFDPMDDTPMVANHKKKNRPTRTEIAEAATNPELTPKTALKQEIVNAIIAAGLHTENETRHPGTTPHKGGILDDHEGHIAVDETHVAVGTWNLPKNKAPGNFIARTHGHSKVYLGAPSVIGLTLAVTAASPTQATDVPSVCLGAAIHHPTAGLGSAVLTTIDAIDANNLRAPKRSNQNHQAIFDGGYTESIDLNRNLTAHDYSMVMKYAKDQRTLHEIQAVNHDDGNRTPGIRLYNGRPLCPGASMAHLARTHLQVPDFADRKNPDGTKRPYTGKELAQREDTLKTILPYVMPTSGRPQEVPDNPRGGQAKTATPRDPVMRVTLTCPHVAGKARCRIFSDYDDPDLEHLPTVPAPPIDLPIHQRPSCCANNSGTISARIPLPEFKDWQDFMAGTWEHADWYSGPRSANERYNAQIKHTQSGANITKGAIAPRKAAPFALFTAMAIAYANRVSIETWYAHNNTHGGTKRAHRSPRNKQRRDQKLAEYRADQKSRRAG